MMRLKGESMKALLIAGLFFSLPSLAQIETQEVMAHCKAIKGDSVFSLFRQVKDHHLGSIFNYVNGRPALHEVEIQYTNAGARDRRR